MARPALNRLRKELAAMQERTNMLLDEADETSFRFKYVGRINDELNEIARLLDVEGVELDVSLAKYLGRLDRLRRDLSDAALVRRLTWVGDSHSDDAVRMKLHSYHIVGSDQVTGTPVRNFSYPGATAPAIAVSSLTEKIWNDVVVIIAGRNGVTNPATVTAAREAIAEMAERVADGRYIVIGVPHLAIETTFTDLNVLLAADHAGKYIVPPSLNTYNSGDDIHYSDLGYIILTDLVEAQIFSRGLLPDVDVGLPTALATHSLHIPNAGHVTLGPTPAPLNVVPNVDQFTIVCWYKSADDQAAVIANAATALGASFLLGVNTNNLYVAAGGVQVASATAINDDTWRFIALVCGPLDSPNQETKTLQSFHVDNFTSGGTAVGATASNGEARIGSRNDGSWQFNGRIYQLAFFRGRRYSSALLRDLAPSGAPRAPSTWRHAPHALWMFDDADGTDFPDWAGRVPGTGVSLSDANLSLDIPTP